MRALLPLLALLAAAAAEPALPDAGTSVLSPDSESRWVPFTLTSANQIRFTAMLDGRPVEALLDTGASRSILSRPRAERDRRKLTRMGYVQAIGGAIPSDRTGFATLAFGGLSLGGGSLRVVAIPVAVTGDGAAVDLLIGSDLLARYALDIDPAARRFRLLPSGRLPFAGTSVPLKIGGATASYLTMVGIAGRRVRPIVVDTGDGTELTVSRSVWRTLPLAQVPALTTQLGQGAGGAVIAEVGTLPDASLGAEPMRDVAVWVEPTGGHSDLTRTAGRIGMGLLGRYRVLLDPAAGRMILAPIPYAVPSRRVTSGLQLVGTPDYLQILHVMRNSPAAAARLRIGDRICSVDGARVSPSRDPEPWLTAAPGTVVALGLCDGSTRELTLRRFY